jgi:poly(3-hydroxybutyrate) depolymerase
VSRCAACGKTSADYPIDPEHVYIAGFSEARIAQRLALATRIYSVVQS